MQRGDYSMGSVQTSTAPRARKRRAALACKSRKVLDAARFADERDCVAAVLDGGAERVLAALDALGDACAVDATHACL